MRLTLSFASGTSSRLEPVHDGAAVAEGVDFVSTHVHPSELFWRQLRFGDFDVSEMSLSSLFISWSQGNRDWVALPVFPRREFFHTRIVVREGAGIDTPEQLRGTRMGVPEYQQTAAVWARGALSDEFGITAADLDWYMERAPELSHGGATAFVPPEGVRLQHIAAPDSMQAMMQRGDLDAALLFITERTLVDRSVAGVAGASLARPLFADRAAEAARLYKKTGVCPLNHCIVVRRSLVDEHPWLALNLFHAFDAARARTYDTYLEYLRLSLQLGDVDAADYPPADPFPYGLRTNRKAVETLLRYQQEQGLLKGPVEIDEVFAGSVADL